MSGQMLLKAHYPQGSTQVIATDASEHIFACGLNRTSGAECVGFTPSGEEPFWQVTLIQGGKANDGTLVPGRLYVTTGDGALYAIGDP